MENEILHKIMDKYSRKGKYTRAGAKDVRLLCETIKELLYGIKFPRGGINVVFGFHSVESIMDRLKQNFLMENKP